MVAARQQPGSQQRGHVGRSNRAVCDAAMSSGHLHQRLEPQHATRAVAHHSYARLGGERGSNVVGPGGVGCSIAHVHGDAVVEAVVVGVDAVVDHRGCARATDGITDDGLDARGIDVAEHPAVAGHRRALRTQPEAEDLLDLDRFGGAELERSSLDGLAASRDARLGAAHLHHRAFGGHGAEVLVERDDAVHFRDRQVERVGQQRNVAPVDEPGMVLHCVQRRHQPTCPACVVADDGLDGRVGRVTLAAVGDVVGTQDPTS